MYVCIQRLYLCMLPPMSIYGRPKHLFKSSYITHIIYTTYILTHIIHIIHHIYHIHNIYISSNILVVSSYIWSRDYVCNTLNKQIWDGGGG